LNSIPDTYIYLFFIDNFIFIEKLLKNKSNLNK